MFAFTMVAAWRQRHVGELRQAVVLYTNGRLDEAHALLSAVEKRRLSPRVRLATEMRLGAVSWQRGGLEEAKIHLDRAIGGDQRRSIDHTLARFTRAELSAVQGDLDDARRRAAELAELPELPPGDAMTMVRQSLALVIAFHADDPGSLPDDDTIHLHAYLASHLEPTRDEAPSST